MLKKDFHTKLLEIRKKHALTQGDLSDLLNVSKSYLAQVERLEKNSSFKLAQAVANAFDLPLCEMLNIKSKAFDLPLLKKDAKLKTNATIKDVLYQSKECVNTILNLNNNLFALSLDRDVNYLMLDTDVKYCFNKNDFYIFDFISSKDTDTKEDTKEDSLESIINTNKDKLFLISSLESTKYTLSVGYLRKLNNKLALMNNNKVLKTIEYKNIKGLLKHQIKSF